MKRYERIDCERRRNHGIFLGERSVVCEGNTLSTIVRGLEDKGFLAHKTYGNTYQYYAVLNKEDFSKGTLKKVISKYFNNSYLSAVSSLVKEEDISLEDLKQLIAEVERGKI